MIPSALQDYLANSGFLYAVVANLANSEIQHIGCSSAIGNTDLVPSFFADAESVTALDRSLQGQLLPRVWSQGDISCVVCKPTENVIVGAFCKKKSGPVEQYQMSKKLNDDLHRFWQ
jgi:hypothetical protein